MCGGDDGAGVGCIIMFARNLKYKFKLGGKSKVA